MGVTLLGFPSEADRDAYLKAYPGTACGSRFAVVADAAKAWLKQTQVLAMDHRLAARRTLEIDEHGRIQTSQPLDIVQRARLARFAEAKLVGWRISADSIRQAAAGGLKPTLISHWLADHLAKPKPPLIAQAIDAWMCRSGPSVELGDAVLLHVPDAEPFRAIADSPRLKAFLVGRVGGHWLIVRRDARKELAAVLEELGFTIGRSLTLEGRPINDPRP
jgi:hypothetical protein